MGKLDDLIEDFGKGFSSRVERRMGLDDHCHSCGKQYDDRERRYFCSDSCEERGRVVECNNCNNPFYENLGYNKATCSSSCDDEYYGDD